MKKKFLTSLHNIIGKQTQSFHSTVVGRNIFLANCVSRQTLLKKEITWLDTISQRKCNGTWRETCIVNPPKDM